MAPGWVSSHARESRPSRCDTPRGLGQREERSGGQRHHRERRADQSAERVVEQVDALLSEGVALLEHRDDPTDRQGIGLPADRLRQDAVRAGGRREDRHLRRCERGRRQHRGRQEVHVGEDVGTSCRPRAHRVAGAVVEVGQRACLGVVGAELRRLAYGGVVAAARDRLDLRRVIGPHLSDPARAGRP